MLRQACVSTFKFASLAFLGLNVRPKPAGPTSTAGDLGTKTEEGVAAAAAAATVPLVDPSGQPSPTPPVGSQSTSGGPDSSAGAGTKPQADNPKPQMANPIGGGSANPKDGSTGPSVDPLAPTPPSVGGGTFGPAPTKPTRKATVVWGYPMGCNRYTDQSYTDHVVFYSADRSKNKDTNQATHVGCPSQGCIDKKDGSIQQPQDSNKPPVQPATVSQANKSPVVASASGSDLVTIIEDLVADAAAGELGGKILEEVAVVAAHVATDLGNKIVEGVTTVVSAIAPMDDPEGSDSPKPGPQMVANPIGGSANPEEGTAPGASLPPPPAGGSSGPASTSPTRNPLDPYDKYNYQAMFYITDQSGTKETNQAGAGGGAPSQDATAPAGGGGSGDRLQESIPPQADGASNKPPQQATVVSQAESESQPVEHPDAIIRQYAREAWDIGTVVAWTYFAAWWIS